MIEEVTAATIRFADVEVELPARLYPRLVAAWPTVYVGRSRPDDRSTAVVIRRQGGAPTRLVDRPRIGVNIWAPDDETANALALDTLAALSALGLKDFSATGPAEVGDDSTPYRRRYFSADFRHRGKDITA